MKAHKTIRVATFTGGLVGPSIPMLGPLADGGTIRAKTAPGCWGPMITPSFRGGVCGSVNDWSPITIERTPASSSVSPATFGVTPSAARASNVRALGWRGRKTSGLAAISTVRSAKASRSDYWPCVARAISTSATRQKSAPP